MAQYHLRSIQHRLLPPLVMGASFGTAFTEKVNTALFTLLAVLLLVVNWRFLRLLRGEKKLRLDR